MRTPGLYSSALHAGGPKNGVLTAVEDFPLQPSRTRMDVDNAPAAYGLGILVSNQVRRRVPVACREHLRLLGAAVAREIFPDLRDQSSNAFPQLSNAFPLSEQTSIVYRN